MRKIYSHVSVMETYMLIQGSVTRVIPIYTPACFREHIIHF